MSEATASTGRSPAERRDADAVRAAGAEGAPAKQTAAATTPATDPEIAAMPFDRALAELQTVVGRLETGGLPLEESIELYERGVALHERCAALLSQAELRVQRLVDASGGPRTVDLRPDEADG